MTHYVSAPVERSLSILREFFIPIMEEQDIFGLDDKGEFEHMRCIEIMLRIMSHRSKQMSERVLERWTKKRGAGVR